MESFFKEVSNAYVTVNNLTPPSHKSSSLEEFESLRKKRRLALDNLVSYIDSGDWYGGKGKDDFIRNYKLSNAEHAKRTGRSVVSVRQSMSKASAKLRDKFGYDFINRILTGDSTDLSNVLFELSVASNSSLIASSLLVDVTSRVKRRTASTEYQLSDLSKEMSFLRVYSSIFLNAKLKELDLDKLAYILDVLNNDSVENFKEKCDMLKELNSASKQKLAMALLDGFQLGSVQETLKVLSTIIKERAK